MAHISLSGRQMSGGYSVCKSRTGLEVFVGTRPKLTVAIVATAFALLTTASTAQALTITFSECAGPGCGALTGSVSLTLTDILGGGVEATVNNDTNGDVDAFFLLFSGLVANSSVALTGGATPSYTNYSAAGVISSMGVNTFSTPKNTAGQDYNVEIQFPPPNVPSGGPSNRLSSGEAVNFWIAGINTASYSLGHAHVIAVAGGQSVRLYEVPDGGATVGLLGLAMLGIGYVRRRLA